MAKNKSKFGMSWVVSALLAFAAVSMALSALTFVKIAQFNRRYDCNVLAGVGAAPSPRIKAVHLDRPTPAPRLRLTRAGKTHGAEDGQWRYNQSCAPRPPKPTLAFADKGRYLPSGGTRSIRVASTLVTNINTSIRRVEPKNLVVMLALEEDRYFGVWSGYRNDDKFFKNFSGQCETGTVAVAETGATNTFSRVRIAMNDGGSSNGVYLVAIDRGKEPKFRLVCLSDIGLSVRKSDDAVGVWATSLTTGLPLAGAAVEVYSAANILLAQGVTDAQGWCVPTVSTEGEPFAVIVRSADGTDMTFVALDSSMKVDPKRKTYISYRDEEDLTAFLWTERGIYRHDEKIFTHVIIRNGKNVAPAPLPIRLTLEDYRGRILSEKTIVSDENGVIADDGFTVPAEQPSGSWTLHARLPGKNGEVLGERNIMIEEFTPPQLRVKVSADAACHPSNFSFRIAAEHLIGGAAAQLESAGAVVFEDVAFAPEQWKGYVFGDERRGLKPNYKEFDTVALDDKGEVYVEAPMSVDLGHPKAAVKVTAQGTVFEDGGRPVASRASATLHLYQYYLGAQLPYCLKLPANGKAAIEFVCVDPKGELVRTPRKLFARIERIESVYSYRHNSDDTCSWTSERMKRVVLDNVEIAVGAEGRVRYELPLTDSGDYSIAVEDRENGVAFSREFYLSEWGEETVSAPMNDPTKVTIVADKPLYRVGDKPRLVIRSPFAGWAMMSVMRDQVIYTEIFKFTNATSEVELRAVERDWEPDVEVSISVVQSVAANARHLASRAHGQIPLKVRPIEREIPVRVDAAVRIEDGRTTVKANVDAPGAAFAVVTLVDEGINLLTAECTPNPVEYFGMIRVGDTPLYDIFHRILPVDEDETRRSGLKTGGGIGAELLGRVSPVSSRRFKPLAKWQARVAIANGKGETEFELPEFKGEIRVTAVAYSRTATGSASVQRKVVPKLVMQPDAPRFAAPGDRFDATMTLRNRSGKDGEVDYTFEAARWGRLVKTGKVFLRDGEATNLAFTVEVPSVGATGTSVLKYTSKGLGELHAEEIELPVRPAVGWSSRTEVVRLEPGQKLERKGHGDAHRFKVKVAGSPLAEYVSALEWLAEYPHGCLEQTCSRIFPLITAGGVLNTVASDKVKNLDDYVKAGVDRVESMLNYQGFCMWPDSDYISKNPEFSLYAAHFLVEARKAGYSVGFWNYDTLCRLLREWALSDNQDVSAYACHTLALADKQETDRMFWLYDRMRFLSPLARAQLARAFVAIHEPKRAEDLLAFAPAPTSVKEAAFQALAMLELNADDPRVPALIDYLLRHRDREKLSWGTTSENAHALLAIGAYYQRHPVKPGEVKTEQAVTDNSLAVENTGKATAFVTIREQWLEDVATVTNAENGIAISRRFLRSNGAAADMKNLRPGDFLVVELTLSAPVKRAFSDLVIEDLMPAAFEPVQRNFDPAACGWTNQLSDVGDWVLRTDARDDRVLVFSKQFELVEGKNAKAYYPVRVVSSGDFTVPGPVVEDMYDPRLGARRAPGRVVVRH